MRVVYTYSGLPDEKSGPEKHDCPYEDEFCLADQFCSLCLEDGPADGESQEAYDSRCAGVPRQGPI